MRVALVEAPFGPAAWPSIGTSLLKTRLREAGHDAEVIYLSLRFLDRIGPSTLDTVARYQAVCDSFGIHLGEWIFGKEAFPEADWPRLDAAYFVALKAEEGISSKILDARAWRTLAADFIAETVTGFDWARFDVVGFANSYSQFNASLALARSLRARDPNLRLIMGGCGCADPMGRAVMRLAPILDAVVMGEGDDVIVPLCEMLTGQPGAPSEPPPGVVVRDPDGVLREGPPTKRICDADGLPVPDYDDYFRYRPTALAGDLPHYIPVESSRGCWWGAKHHCTFCGLSPTKMPYFRKSAGRFLSEVRQLAERYSPRRFMAVDNIMPHEYYREVCPKLGAASGQAEFFFEVKANFDAPTLDTFADSNISQIQPGIESLSTPVLKLMKKGTSGPANVYTLRLAQERGLRVHWSILYGFEGESLDHYRHQAALIRRIRHLRPPLGLVLCEVERFSPMYRFPELHGLRSLRPAKWYTFCHPVAPDVLAELAYRFDADRSPETSEIQHRIATEAAPPIAEWQGDYAADRHRLTISESVGETVVMRKVGDFCMRYHLHGAARTLIDLFRRPRELAKAEVNRWWDHPSPYLDARLAPVLSAISERISPDIVLDEDDPTDAFISLLAHGLVIEEEGLAVAVPCFIQREPKRAMVDLPVNPNCVLRGRPNMPL